MRARKTPFAYGMLAAVALWPSLGSAQTSTAPTAGGGRTIASSRSALNKVCAELASTPTALVRAPEGRALLRLNKDLEGAAAAMDMRGQRSRIEVERMSEVQRGLDSLMQFVVQTMKDQDGKERTVVTVRRQGVSPISQAELRGQVVATIRSLQPQIEAFVGTAARGGVQIPMPSGWMGVYLSSSTRNVPSPEGMLTYYCDYPVIEAVHAGSPAEKGGLLAGDTLLAYNGRDVRAAAVNLTTLLVPTRTVRVRYKRDGRTGEVPLTITPAPNQERMSFVRAACPPGGRCEPRGFAIQIDSVRGTRFEVSSGGGMPPNSRVGLNQVYARTFPRAPVPPVDVLLASTNMAVLAGAQLSMIGEEFAQEMGVEPGVLVLAVPPGSPASVAGLRPGEVIRAVNGVPLHDMMALRRAFGSPGVRQLKLTVNAKGASARIVTVRW